eukprot:14085173-Alexandrium_andersonii.AAC.1
MCIRDRRPGTPNSQRHRTSGGAECRAQRAARASEPSADARGRPKRTQKSTPSSVRQGRLGSCPQEPLGSPGRGS